MTLMQKTSLVLISAFPLRFSFSFSSSTLDPQGECEGDSDDSKDNRGGKGSKHSKDGKECKASEDNEGRKGRTIPHRKGQVDALLDGQSAKLCEGDRDDDILGYLCGTSWM
jgi:hypothetical protein